jgi:hypothetical protein
MSKVAGRILLFVDKTNLGQPVGQFGGGIGYGIQPLWAHIRSITLVASSDPD